MRPNLPCPLTSRSSRSWVFRGTPSGTSAWADPVAAWKLCRSFCSRLVRPFAASLVAVVEPSRGAKLEVRLGNEAVHPRVIGVGTRNPSLVVQAKGIGGSGFRERHLYEARC